MATPNNAATLQRTLDNYVRLSLLVTEVIANPTQANVDAIVATAEGAGLVRPKVTYSVDGESYQWESYAESIQRQILAIQKNIVLLSGNYLIRSSGAV